MYRRSLPKLIWYRLTQWVIGGFSRFYFRLRRRGHHNMPPTGPVVVLSNHQSYLDPPMIGCFMPRPIAYLARDTLFRGILGPLIRAYDSIPIDRDGSGLGGIRATLKRIKLGDAVLMFPEGTRTPDGRLQSLKPGFIALVRRGKASILPVGIAGSYEAWPRGRKLPAPKKIALSYGEAIPPEAIAELDDDALLELVALRIATCFAEARQMAGYAKKDPAGE
ncbi:lysophospholipid acyltransferase family protein [Aeoliella mucimassa]|uniref:1-acyl-sn-glycerol-3-phosphate acyltransferase n=1 Tax=Aeoliella mucimassa TaxID=2527972 RepID=A0A518AUY4_9BACT|nr:lysophospholipid acyltransferase family protein [Aeoliella mucimassa]QDU58535.1 1-acyl-sn-glycerol-3-phosphate acyltransferase [Aeoliella mucimassa]